jgi:hypothetical protein
VTLAKRWKRALPGSIALGLVIVTASLWTFWGTAEMYYEGWGAPFPQPLAYLIPTAACLLLTAIVVAWPRAGGWLLIVAGGLFTAWWWALQARRAGGLHLGALLGMFPVSGMIVVTGVLFLIEGRRRRQGRGEVETVPRRWIVRHLRHVLGLGIPLLVLLVVSAVQLPGILLRVDDGDQSARLIEGNGVMLVWAPAGPGWNGQQAGISGGGWNPSWNALAWYGRPPVGLGNKPDTEDKSAIEADADAEHPADTEHPMETTGLCRYLAGDGVTLMEEPQDIWRMPTTDELVRSLVRRGKNAGCTWNGDPGRATCRVRPDKETPLWAPEGSAIYYWTADAYDTDRAWYVSYNGWVRHQPRDWGNPRHGHRCVREP